MKSPSLVKLASTAAKMRSSKLRLRSRLRAKFSKAQRERAEQATRAGKDGDGPLERGGALYRYFAGLDRCDQVTFIIITALAFAIGLAFSAIVAKREPAEISSPRFTVSPFVRDFAAAAAGPRV